MYFQQSGFFSVLAWKRIHPIYLKIKAHPFNQELGMGVLDINIFKVYCSQDAIYLDTYSQALSMLAHVLTNPCDKMMIMQFAHEVASEKNPLATLMPSTQATRNYTQFLQLVIKQYAQSALIAAAVLPCFWIYYQLAYDLRNAPILNSPQHPYAHWIRDYSSEEYHVNVLKMIHLTNRLASEQPKFSTMMLDFFVRASEMELSFWHDSYYYHPESNMIYDKISVLF